MEDSSIKDEQNVNKEPRIDKEDKNVKKDVGEKRGPGSEYNNSFLRPIKPGEVRNPTGRPKGSVSLSTRIREMMNDEKFVFKNSKGEVILEGKPMDVIVSQAMLRASKGDMRAFDMLGKYGFGSKVDVTTDGKALPTPILSLEEPKQIIDIEADNGVLRNDGDQENKDA
jgi:hypothetical protein